MIPDRITSTFNHKTKLPLVLFALWLASTVVPVGMLASPACPPSALQRFAGQLETRVLPFILLNSSAIRNEIHSQQPGPYLNSVFQELTNNAVDMDMLERLLDISRIHKDTYDFAKALVNLLENQS
jgi:hypothetical protein